MINIKDYLNDCIKRYIERNINKFCFNIGPFSIPKEIVTNKKKRVNIEMNRNKLLKEGNSPYAVNMENYLKDIGVRYVKEFVIIIQDFNLWEISLSILNLTEDERNNYLKTNYFSLDFFLPDSLTCIEVDSNYHNNRKKLDKARDYYISNYYNIKTYRFYHFKEDENNPNQIELRNRIRMVSVNPNFLFNYSSIVFNNFIYSNESFIVMIERFINWIGQNNFFTRSDEFTITEKDYNILADGLFEKTINPMTFSDYFIEIADKMIGCKITICKNIINYSISEIYYIINNRNNPLLIREIISNNRFNKIPYWISKIIKIPNNLKSYILGCNWEDNTILYYIKLYKLI